MRGSASAASAVRSGVTTGGGRRFRCLLLLIRRDRGGDTAGGGGAGARGSADPRGAGSSSSLDPAKSPGPSAPRPARSCRLPRSAPRPRRLAGIRRRITGRSVYSFHGPTAITKATRSHEEHKVAAWRLESSCLRAAAVGACSGSHVAGLERRRLDAIPVDRDADPGPVGTGDGAVGADLDARLDQIGHEVAAARGDVAGSEKFGSDARWMLWARPMPLSSMPPCQTGMPCAAQRSWTRMDSPWPPTRPGLMLMMRQAWSAIASSAARTVWIDSSRQIGVVMPPLQRRVIADVVVLERLLDHHQIEAIEPGEVMRHPRACRPRWRRPSAEWRRSARGSSRPRRRPSPA